MDEIHLRMDIIIFFLFENYWIMLLTNDDTYYIMESMRNKNDNRISAVVTIDNATHGKRTISMKFRSINEMFRFQDTMTHAEPTQQHINIIELNQTGLGRHPLTEKSK
jgi:hypothetical protein